MDSMKHMNHVQTSTYDKDDIHHKGHKDHNKPGFMVRAVKRGIYGVQERLPGDVFQIKYARHFADVDDPATQGLGWMERYDDSEPKVQRKARPARGARAAGIDPEERQQAMEAMDEEADKLLEADRKRGFTAPPEEEDVI